LAVGEAGVFPQHVVLAQVRLGVQHQVPALGGVVYAEAAGGKALAGGLVGALVSLGSGPAQVGLPFEGGAVFVGEAERGIEGLVIPGLANRGVVAVRLDLLEVQGQQNLLGGADKVGHQGRGPVLVVVRRFFIVVVEKAQIHLPPPVGVEAMLGRDLDPVDHGFFLGLVGVAVVTQGIGCPDGALLAVFMGEAHPGYVAVLARAGLADAHHRAVFVVFRGVVGGGEAVGKVPTPLRRGLPAKAQVELAAVQAGLLVEAIVLGVVDIGLNIQNLAGLPASDAEIGAYGGEPVGPGVFLEAHVVVIPEFYRYSGGECEGRGRGRRRPEGDKQQRGADL